MPCYINALQMRNSPNFTNFIGLLSKRAFCLTWLAFHAPVRRDVHRVAEVKLDLVTQETAKIASRASIVHGFSSDMKTENSQSTLVSLLHCQTASP